MVSLADYLSLLARLTTDESEQNDLRHQARVLLERLMEIDPDRRERYRESIGMAA